jgi:hypothetical protein
MMTEEDEAFNEIERQAKQRKESVKAAFVGYEHAVLRLYSYQNELRNDTLEEVLQCIKELRPAIMPLEGMGRGKATQEWFDILAKHIEEMKK